MKKLIFFFSLLLSLSAGATTFTEFFCQTSGSNLNAGSTTNDAANTTYAGGTWVAATLVFTVASGNPTTDTGVTNGAWASVYTTAGATIATCVGMITNTTSTTITLDARTISGAASNPSATAAATTCKVGGAWKGPNAAVGFPFNFIAAVSTNGPNIFPRVSFRNNATFSITAAITHSLNGPLKVQGMTSVPDDGGKATIDGGTSGASYALLTVSGTAIDLSDLIFSDNGASGSASGVSSSAARFSALRCVFHDFRGNGLDLSSGGVVTECEAYNCNQNNTTILSGFNTSASLVVFRNCISHDNTGSFCVGISIGASVVLINCIMETNGRYGLRMNNGSTAFLFAANCDFYNNTTAGIDMSTCTVLNTMVENCNFVKNGNGITNNVTIFKDGYILNNGFGAGTQANTIGNFLVPSGVADLGSFSYASNVTPWVDPANGDFRVNLAAAKAAGRGVFTQTAASFAGSIAYPDMGAVQGASTNTTAGASGGSYTFAQ